MMDFLLNYSNEYIMKYYEKENCLIEDFDNKTNRCMIFFSSNGLYYPNTIGEFCRVVDGGGRYEWQSIARSKLVQTYFQKVIYVRDLFKQWYVVGISSEYNTIDKLIKHLESLVLGYELYTAGSSAGGYMAALVGAKLKAKAAYDFSGQFRLSVVSGNDIGLLKLYKDDPNRNKYYDILDYLQGNTSIFYFYPSGSQYDVEQAALVEERAYSNLYVFKMDSNLHGHTVKGKNLPTVLTKDVASLIEICNRYSGKKIKPFTFFANTAGYRRCIVAWMPEKLYRLREICHNILSFIHMR